MTGKEPPSAPRLSKGDWAMSWLCCYQSSFHKKKERKKKNVLYASFCMTCWAFIDFIFSFINLKSVWAYWSEKQLSAWQITSSNVPVWRLTMWFNSELVIFWNKIILVDQSSLFSSSEWTIYCYLLHPYVSVSAIFHRCVTQRTASTWLFVITGHLTKYWRED